ncbi:MAG: metalloregulator ArsR/SmtB family transcription factor [Gammaproteobacteria bacterium]|nr:metalloregulator ArsR/SmtB family transcription factor [Gammaproteobacteria bacterium]
MTSDSLSMTFSALADPTRRAILERLRSGKATVGELAEPFAMSLPAVSKHLRVLEKAALINRENEAQWRLCSLAPEPLQEADGWLSRYRGFWQYSLAQLGEYLNQTTTELDDDG